jgi:hypothetical protein
MDRANPASCNQGAWEMSWRISLKFFDLFEVDTYLRKSFPPRRQSLGEVAIAEVASPSAVTRHPIVTSRSIVTALVACQPIARRCVARCVNADDPLLCLGKEKGEVPRCTSTKMFLNGPNVRFNTRDIELRRCKSMRYGIPGGTDFTTLCPWTGG